MNFIILVILLFTTNITLFSSNKVEELNINKNVFVGIWSEDLIMGSAWTDVWIFYENSEFEYICSQYTNPYNRLEKIGGKFKVKNNKLFIKFEYVIEKVGGKYSLSDDPLVSGFIITNFKTKKIKYNEIFKEIKLSLPNNHKDILTEINDSIDTENDLDFILENKVKKLRCLELNNLQLYKLYNNPYIYNK